MITFVWKLPSQIWWIETTIFLVLSLPHSLAMIYGRIDCLLKIHLVIHDLVIWNYEWEIPVSSEYFNCSYLNVACFLLPYTHNNQTVQAAEKWESQLWMGKGNFYIRPQEKETERVAFWIQEQVPSPHFHLLGDYSTFLYVV